jgi:hypothetical protein
LIFPQKKGKKENIETIAMASEVCVRGIESMFEDGEEKR